MSMLDVGKRCAACHTIDFLPTLCPHCSEIFCATHIRNHLGCLAAPVEGEIEVNAIAGPSTFQRRNKCPVEGCERLTIEAIGGLGAVDKGEEEAIAREVRCPGCGQAFCASHRQRSQHACKAPTDHNQRNDAFLKRKATAAEIIAKNFPEHAGKVVPKPPPQRDVERVRPTSPPRLPPSLQPQPSTAPAGAATTADALKKSGGKSRAEKLHDMHIRKLRSLAKPLFVGMSSTRDDEKRFFAWCTGDTAKLSTWQECGEIKGTPERVWVPITSPVGKILDKLIRISHMPSHASDGPSETIKLFCLAAPPDAPRSVTELDNSRPAGEVIAEGSIVCLVKGER